MFNSHTFMFNKSLTETKSETKSEKTFDLNRILADIKAEKIKEIDLSAEKIIDEKTAQALDIANHPKEVYCLAVLPNNCFIAGFYDGYIKIWDAQGKCLTTVKDGKDIIYALAGLPDGNFVSGDYNAVKLWNVKGECLAKHEYEYYRPGHYGTYYVSSLAVLPNGNFVSGSWSSASLHLRGNKGKCLATLTDGSANATTDNDGVHALAVFPDGRFISGAGYKHIKLWSTDGKCLATVTTGYERYVNSLAVLPNGNFISSSDGSAPIKVWDANGKCLATLENSKATNALAVLPTGNFISASHDKNIKLWNMNGKYIATIAVQKDPITHLAVLPDGRFISGSNDSQYKATIKLWNFQTRTLQLSDIQPILAALKHNSSVKKLNLQNVQLTDNNVLALAEYIGANKSLIELDIRNTLITTQGAASLYQALKRHPSLTQILHPGINQAEVSYNLSVRYLKGDNTAPDEKQAVEWLKKAAAQNHVNAQFDLACSYFKGSGVARDEKQAVEWLKKAAVQNHVNAQFDLACSYLKGSGVTQDEKQAVEWLKKAAAQNHAGAREQLEKIQRQAEIQAQENHIREEQQLKKQAEEKRCATFLQQLKEVEKSSKLPGSNLSVVNQQYQALESEAIQVRSIEFYVSRGQFYDVSAQKEKSPLRQETLYNKALQDYRQALDYDPFVENVSERIEAIGSLLRSKTAAPASAFFTNTSTSTNTQAPKREELTQEQLAKLEQIKARLRQQAEQQNTQSSVASTTTFPTKGDSTPSLHTKR